MNDIIIPLVDEQSHDYIPMGTATRGIIDVLASEFPGLSNALEIAFHVLFNMPQEEREVILAEADIDLNGDEEAIQFLMDYLEVGRPVSYNKVIVSPSGESEVKAWVMAK